MARPLLITDCDGVLVEFAGPFARYLADAHGLSLKLETFAMVGNIRDAAGAVVPPERFPGLLDGFFTTYMPQQPAVAGAVQSLARVAEMADVVVLTNVPHVHAETRSRALAALGMPYRVVSNQGPKGTPISGLMEEFGASRAVFIDDLPYHHSSARALAPWVHRLHMVAEHELREIVPHAPDADARIDDWADALPHIEALFGA